MSKHYKADGYPVQGDGIPVTPARVFHQLNIQNGAFYGPPIKDASQTRAFGGFSPANGSTLTYADEDGVWWDCYLFHAAGYGDTSGYNTALSNPYPGQSQVFLYGTASNPLNAPQATIAWNALTIWNYQNQDYVTAYSSITHSCFPAHTLQANRWILYNWMPPQSDPNYIFSCLVYHSNMVQVVTPVRQVPCA